MIAVIIIYTITLCAMPIFVGSGPIHCTAALELKMVHVHWHGCMGCTTCGTSQHVCVCGSSVHMVVSHSMIVSFQACIVLFCKMTAFVSVVLYQSVGRRYNYVGMPRGSRVWKRLRSRHARFSANNFNLHLYSWVVPARQNAQHSPSNNVSLGVARESAQKSIHVKRPGVNSRRFSFT